MQSYTAGSESQMLGELYSQKEQLVLVLTERMTHDINVSAELMDRLRGRFDDQRSVPQHTSAR